MPVMSSQKASILGLNTQERMNALLNVSRGNAGENGFQTIIQRLTRAGERFCKDDLKTKDGSIGQLLQRRGSKGFSSISIIDQIMAELLKHGEVITAQDWTTTQNAQGETALDWAIKKRVIPKIFKPELWVNRISEMDALWEAMPENAQSQMRDYHEKRRQALALSKPEPEIPAVLTKKDLFVPDQDGLALMDDHRAWKKWDTIVTALRRTSVSTEKPSVLASAFAEIALDRQDITKRELLSKSTSGKPYIQVAAEAGVLDKVIKSVTENGERFTREELISAGLEPYVKDADRQLNQAAQDGNDDMLEQYSNNGIADVNSKQSNGYTPAMTCASKGHSNGIWILLVAGADPDARSGKNESLNLLWLTAKHADETATATVISSLKEKYAESPFALLSALTTISSRVTPTQAARGAGKTKSAEVIDKAIDDVAGLIADMPAEELGKFKVNGKSALDMLIAAGRLKSVFTVSKWRGNPRGMQEMAGHIPKEELDKQLSGKDGTPTYAQILSQVNAGTIKGMSQRTFEIV